MPPISPADPEMIEFLRELVRLPSLSGAEGQVAEAVAKKMTALGYDEVRCDAYGSVIGIRRGAAPGKRILFDAHMDIVPATSPEAWTHPPFSAELVDGRVWGRGSSDTKASLAAIVMSVGRLARDDFRGELIVSASVGEEILEGGSLAPILDEQHPDLVIIGEPTSCDLGTGQRGRVRLDFKTLGRAAHSSSPDQSLNAVLMAAELIQRIHALPLPTHPLVGKGLMAPIQISSLPAPSASTVPYECTIVYDRRLMPGESIESVLNEYQQGLSNLANWQVEVALEGYRTYTGVDLRLPDFHPAWVMPPDSNVVTTALQALKDAGLQPATFIAPYCTNGSASGGERGMPTLIFGPSGIDQAHIVDESLAIDELARGAAGYIALAKALS
jgi:putative selenium metabolism hydrolase